MLTGGDDLRAAHVPHLWAERDLLGRPAGRGQECGGAELQVGKSRLPWCDPTARPDQFVRLMEEHRPTFLHLVPPLVGWDPATLEKITIF